MRTQPVGAHHDGVGAEASRSRAHAPREVGRRIAGEGDDQGHDHHPVAVEVVGGDDRAESDDAQRHDPAEQQAEPGDLVGDRSAALVESAAVADGAPELLLERQEEPGRQGERGEPQRGDRLERVGAADRVLADLEEEVGGDAGDQQRQRDGDGSLRQRRAQRGAGRHAGTIGRGRVRHGNRTLPPVAAARSAPPRRPSVVPIVLRSQMHRFGASGCGERCRPSAGNCDEYFADTCQLDDGSSLCATDSLGCPWNPMTSTRSRHRWWRSSWSTAPAHGSTRRSPGWPARTTRTSRRCSCSPVAPMTPTGNRWPIGSSPGCPTRSSATSASTPGSAPRPMPCSTWSRATTGSSASVTTTSPSIPTPSAS